MNKLIRPLIPCLFFTAGLLYYQGRYEVVAEFIVLALLAFMLVSLDITREDF